MRKEKGEKEKERRTYRCTLALALKFSLKLKKFIPKTKTNIWKCKVKDAPNTKPSVLYSVRFSVQCIIFDLESAILSDYG